MKIAIVVVIGLSQVGFLYWFIPAAIKQYKAMQETDRKLKEFIKRHQ